MAVFCFPTEGLGHPDPTAIRFWYYNPALLNKKIMKVVMIELPQCSCMLCYDYLPIMERRKRREELLAGNLKLYSLRDIHALCNNLHGLFADERRSYQNGLCPKFQ